MLFPIDSFSLAVYAVSLLPNLVVDEVMQEVLPHVDAIAIQPSYKPDFPRGLFAKIHEKTGKRISNSDSFRRCTPRRVARIYSAEGLEATSALLRIASECGFQLDCGSMNIVNTGYGCHPISLSHTFGLGRSDQPTTE